MAPEVPENFLSLPPAYPTHPEPHRETPMKESSLHASPITSNLWGFFRIRKKISKITFFLSIFLIFDLSF